jgi:hypothetical protein
MSPQSPRNLLPLVDFRNGLADLLEKLGARVPHRGLLLSTGEADLQVIMPDGTEIEVVMREVVRDGAGS